MNGAVGRAVSSDGSVIAFARTGVGPSLLLVHGGGLDARQWDRVAPLLAADLAVHAIDRRGRGSSDPIRAGHAVDREAEDIAAVARAIPGPVHLLGHSSGARYALEAALLLGDLASLVLYEPSLLGRITPSALDEIARLEAAGDREGILRVWQVDVIGNTADGFAALRRGRTWPMLLDNAPTLAPELRALARYERRLEFARFARISCPVLLLLGGESDAEMSRTVREVHAAIPQSRIEMLPGQRHSAMLGAPDVFAAAVRRFLGGRRAASAREDAERERSAEEEQ